MKSQRADALLLALTLAVAGGCADGTSLPSSEPASEPASEPSLSEAALPLQQAPRLLKDLATSSPSMEDQGSSPGGYTRVGDVTYFVGSTTRTGAELWKTDGTEAGTVLVKDLAPGALGSNPQQLTAVGDTLFFIADEPGAGVELWKSDGTEAGTVLVKDLTPGALGTTYRSLVALGTTLLFVAQDKATGSELWRSDGTAAGTVLVKDLYPGTWHSNPEGLTVMGGSVYFSANSGGSIGTELWKSDGTTAGTVLVKDIQAGYGSSAPIELTAVGGTLYFSAITSTHGDELWRSDGTAAGTVLVKDISPGSSDSSPQKFAAVGGTVFFAASTSATGTELWRTDGTEAGTFLVKDLSPGSASGSPSDLVAVGGTLFFSASEPATGRELWKSDGTADGTLLVSDLRSGTTSAYPNQLLAFNGRLYFRLSSGPLYTSDGTAAGTFLVNSTSSYETPVVAGNVMLFTGQDSPSTEPWKSDGTAAGTGVLKNLQPNVAASRPSQFTRAGNKVFFRARPPWSSYGFSLYQTDGTEAGTSALGTLTAYSELHPQPLASIGSTAFFVGSGPTGAELWKSDGTAAGTVLVKDLYPGSSSASPNGLTALDQTLFFSAREPTVGVELWKTDGTEAGTVLVKDINPGSASSSPSNLAVMNGVLYFSATDGYWGQELWRSDGTAAGTVLLKDIQASGYDSTPSNMTVVGNTLYFVATTRNQGAELWKTDGTSAGTVLVKDIQTAYGIGSSPSQLTAVGNTLFFQATDAAGGTELWKTDGTAAGTVLVKDIYPGAGSALPRFLTAVNSRLFFGASSPDAGYELWVSDGTEAGTVGVRDLLPGTGSGLAAQPMLGLGPEGLLLFTATDGSGGMEPWVSDGTAANTRQFLDVVPGAGSSAPGDYQRNQQLLYFSAEDGVRGREPWVYSLASISDAVPPTVTCPAAVAVEATGLDGATVSYPPASAFDDKPAPPTLAYSHPSGSRFPVGTTLVTVTATDASGNEATCTFPVKVRDTTGPSITCPAEFTAEATGLDGARVDYAPATATDLASTPSLSYTLPPGSTFPLGTTTVTATATDGAGLRASCALRVKVVDTTAPSLTCPASFIAGASGPDGGPVVYPPASVQDAASASPSVTYSRASGSAFVLGTTAVTVTAVDTAGNRSTCGFNVTVKDLTPPTLSCPANVFAQATGTSGASVRFPPATAADALSRVSLAYSQGSGSVFPHGTTPVTVTATDTGGNVATCTFSVSVQDTLPPTLSCPASVTAEATDIYGAQVTYPALTAADASGPVTLSFSQPSGTLFPLGVSQVTATAMDSVGNSSSCAFIVTVRDTTAPTLTCPFNLTVETQDARGVSVSYPSASATDAVTASPSFFYSKERGSTFPPGQTRVTVVATDESGNAATCHFYVTVRDAVAPSITCPAPVVAEATGSAGAPVHYGAAIASDVVALSPAVTYSHAAGSTFPLGTTVVTASATDSGGNVAQCTFTVTVRDTHAPALQCPAALVAQATSTSGARVSYPSGSLVTPSDGVSSTTVSYSPPSGSAFPMGSTPVTVTATDGSGNRATCAFHVIVVDSTAPALTCPAAVSVEALEPAGAGVTYPPPTASDLFPVTLSASQPSGATFPVGTTVVTVTAADSSGNTSLCTFPVQVRDTTAPTLTCPGTVTADAAGPDGASVVYPRATASDAVTPEPDITYSHGSGTLFPVGTTALSAVARDAAGNSATCTFDVVVRPPPNG